MGVAVVVAKGRPHHHEQQPKKETIEGYEFFAIISLRSTTGLLLQLVEQKPVVKSYWQQLTTVL